MLINFADCFRRMQLDVISGYNTDMFDFTYVMRRASVLGVNLAWILGTLPENVDFRERVFTSSNTGSRRQVDVILGGMQSMDLMRYIHWQKFKFKSYKLGSVAEHFGQGAKDEVRYDQIYGLFYGSQRQRDRLNKYGWRDSDLVVDLIVHVRALQNMIATAQICHVPINVLLHRGMHAQMTGMILRRMRPLGRLVPFTDHQKHMAYQGATVVEPRRGYYKKPIATLDFASLYPSIMRQHNLCMTGQILSSEDAVGLDPERDLETHKHTDGRTSTFVRSHVQVGVLVQILTELLTARSAAKDELKKAKKAKNYLSVAVLDARQKALKVAANSLYGLMAGPAQPRAPVIAAVVTLKGRHMIEATKRYIESHFTLANGYADNAIVIYGDTDSVMVDFFPNSAPPPADPAQFAAWKKRRLAEVRPLFLEAGEGGSALFGHFVRLEPEKVYMPYLLMNKKRYAGIMHEDNSATKTLEFTKIDTKGLETAQAGQCMWLKTVLSEMIDALGTFRPDEAREVARRHVRRLMSGQVYLHELAYSKKYGREFYANEPAHVALVRSMKRRDPGSAPQVGDTVSYVYKCAPKNSKVRDCLEDPLYLASHAHILPDYRRYFDNGRKGIERLLALPLGLANGEYLAEITDEKTRKKKLDVLGAIAGKDLWSGDMQEYIGGAHLPSTVMDDLRFADAEEVEEAGEEGTTEEDDATEVESREETRMDDDDDDNDEDEAAEAQITATTRQSLAAGRGPSTAPSSVDPSMPSSSSAHPMTLPRLKLSARIAQKGGTLDTFMPTSAFCSACFVSIHGPAPVDPGTGTVSAVRLCDKCMIQRAQITQTTRADLSKTSQEFKAVWDICIKCKDGVDMENCRLCLCPHWDKRRKLYGRARRLQGLYRHTIQLQYESAGSAAPAPRHPAPHPCADPSPMTPCRPPAW